MRFERLTGGKVPLAAGEISHLAGRELLPAAKRSVMATNGGTGDGFRAFMPGNRGQTIAKTVDARAEE
jgi:hypothetical protein